MTDFTGTCLTQFSFPGCPTNVMKFNGLHLSGPYLACMLPQFDSHIVTVSLVSLVKEQGVNSSGE